MLSLKASRADNFYYGNIEDEKKKKILKKKEKKKKSETYDEIKFEVPYTIICSNCKNYIYKGERFKSERTKAGYYLSICFYSFLIYCKHCPNKIIFETNPKDCSYDIKEGAKQKNEQYENVLTVKGKNNFSHFNLEHIKKKRANPFLLLEHRVLSNKKSHDVINSQNVLNEEHNNFNKKQNLSEQLNGNLSDKNSPSEKETKEEQNSDQKEIDDESTEEDINDVIRETYKRNTILEHDYKCNSNLRKELRDIKRYKVEKREKQLKKNIFINILDEPYSEDEAKLKNNILITEAYKKKLRKKKDFIKNMKSLKKKSIFHKKYLKQHKA